jgi:hypothetical protein
MSHRAYEKKRKKRERIYISQNPSGDDEWGARNRKGH